MENLTIKNLPWYLVNKIVLITNTEYLSCYLGKENMRGDYYREVCWACDVYLHKTYVKEN